MENGWFNRFLALGQVSLLHSAVADSCVLVCWSGKWHTMQIVRNRIVLQYARKHNKTRPATGWSWVACLPGIENLILVIQ